MKRITIGSEEIKKVDQDKFLQTKVDDYNNSVGNLKDYDCPLCKNKGYTMHIVENYDVLKPCQCRRVRESIKHIKNSGLEQLLNEYTFENYLVEEEWQQKVKRLAQHYVHNNHGNWFFMGGQVGCVDSDTEYFNGTQWKKISEYQQGEKVLQYTHVEKYKEGKAELVEPINYIKAPARTLWEIKTDRGSIDQCLSLNHNFAYLSSKGNFNKKPFIDVIDTHNRTTQGFYGKVITTFEYGGKGIELSDDEIRLMVAVIADGSFQDKNIKCRIRIKKERKKIRLENLFSRLNMEYKKNESKEYSIYSFYAPRREKHFSEYWYGCSQDQLKVIADEVLYWDGSQTDNRRTFSTTNKESAEFIQFVFSSTGTRATISSQNRIGKLHKSIEYTVVISNNKLLSMAKSSSQNNKVRIEEVETKDGFQYCFTVPSGNLVLRRNNRIFVTGNSGKSHICTAIVKELLEQG